MHLVLQCCSLSVLRASSLWSSGRWLNLDVVEELSNDYAGPVFCLLTVEA